MPRDTDSPPLLLRVSSLGVEIGRRRVLEGVSFEVRRGEIVSILGPNGAGKTTLLKAIAGLIPHTGEVEVWGRVAYLPQEKTFNTFIPFTVGDVAYLGVKDRDAVREILRKLSVEDENQTFHTLSGGQKQKVLIARFLGTGADIFLLDEPFTGLDKVSSLEFERVLKMLKERGKGIVLVSHDVGHTLSLSDRVLCLNRKVFYHGKPKYDPKIFAQTYGISVVPMWHDH